MTRKVYDAKDISTNELIYFKGHSKATYMSDGSTVEDIINNININDNIKDVGYSIINLGSTSSVTLFPNVYYISDCESTLNISFEEGEKNVVNEYIIEIKGSVELSLPNNIIWLNGDTPEMNLNSNYRISIVNGLASYLEIKNILNIYLTLNTTNDENKNTYELLLNYLTLGSVGNKYIYEVSDDFHIYVSGIIEGVEVKNALITFAILDGNIFDITFEGLNDISSHMYCFLHPNGTLDCYKDD